MKSSQYNVFVKAGDSHFVYNTLKNSLVAVDEELRSCLEKNVIDAIDPSFVDPLKAYGVITDDALDELKVYRLNHNLKKYNTKKASSFLVFTTYSCNLQCPYCYEGAVINEEDRSAFMSKKTAVDVVTFIEKQTLKNKSTVVGIGLYGGEPLLNREGCETVLKEVSEWCKMMNIRFYATITTNGTLLTEEVYKSIGKYVSSIHITLDGPQKFHDKKRVTRNGSGSYALILQHLKQLRDTKEHISVRINVDKENSQDIDEVLTDLETIGVKGRPHFTLYFSQVVPQDSCLTFSTDPAYKEMMKDSLELLPPLIKMAQEKGWGTHLAVDLGEEHSLVPSNVVSCEYLRYGVYAVDPQGDLYICPASAGNPQYCVGKIVEGGAQWNTSYYDAITRDPSTVAPCNTCEVLPMCGGGCALGSAVTHQSYQGAFCNFTKDMLYQRLKSYLMVKYPEKF